MVNQLSTVNLSLLSRKVFSFIISNYVALELNGI